MRRKTNPVVVIPLLFILKDVRLEALLLLFPFPFLFDVSARQKRRGNGIMRGLKNRNCFKVTREELEVQRRFSRRDEPENEGERKESRRSLFFLPGIALSLLSLRVDFCTVRCRKE